MTTPTIATLDVLAARAAQCGWPAFALDNQPRSGEAAWRSALADPRRQYVRTMLSERLDEAEALAEQRAAREWREPSAADHTLNTDEQAALRRELAAEAQASAEHRRSPEARLDVLIEIRDLLRELKDQPR